MKKFNFPLWQATDYDYKYAAGFVPNVMAYLHDEDTNQRPAIVVAPGGGYTMVSPSEGDPVARKFYGLGYNVFVCVYTVTCYTDEPVRTQPLKDLSRAVRLIRLHQNEWQVDPNQIVGLGFSAGGHLVANLGTHAADCPESDPDLATCSNRLNAMVLGYPVITSGQYGHQPSFECLLGKDATAAQRQAASLETQVTSTTPPTFIWHTIGDHASPVENSLLFAHALHAAKVPVALHIFTTGDHGQGLADQDWADRNFGDWYPVQQLTDVVEKQNELGLTFSEEALRWAHHGTLHTLRQANPEVMVWPELARDWLDVTLDQPVVV